MSKESESKVVPITGLYEEYFLDYASYVILERAIPSLEDGLKPVQRRILHSMRQMDDGRYHKVANIIGHSMQYHPHGDAAIGDALVKLGQLELMVDTQGNWGDARTGDSAAAPRYIEARLSKFALEIAFNKAITDFQLSYDGRNQEPVNLPMKFPLLLAQGVDGIAVGLSTKILPHNFLELIDASIAVLRGKSFELYPDFSTGGSVDVSAYDKGQRGGRVKSRATIEKLSKSELLVTSLPYGVTTDHLIDSILKANSRGKINIKKIVDNTAENVEILIDIDPKVNADLTIDALFAFTKCEESISPNACVIVDGKPVFTSVDDILVQSTMLTKELIRQELGIVLRDLKSAWHAASLEKIFIEKKVYRHIEEAESWEDVLRIVDHEMRKFIRTPEEPQVSGDTRLVLGRPFIEDDIIRLTEIKIKRISKYNSFKADEHLSGLEAKIEEVEHHLEHLVDYAVDYFKKLKEKYGKGRERKTEIKQFESIEVQQVAANNTKLYVDWKEGFVGYGVKGGDFLKDCSDLDDVITFLKDGTFVVNRIDEKLFVGKNILHVAIWSKGDERTTYNLIYVDGESGATRAKRFNVTAITRDKKYSLTKNKEGSRVLHFSANPNGEAELVSVYLSPSSKARKKIFDFDFSELDIKGRSSQGNLVTKYPVRKIELKSQGESTLGAMKVWVDDASGRFNNQELGIYIGDYNHGDILFILYKDGRYEMREIDLNFTQKVDFSNVLEIRKYRDDLVVSAVYYEGGKEWTMVKRFRIETNTLDSAFDFLTDHKKTSLIYASTSDLIEIQYVKDNRTESVQLQEFIDVKGWKAIGNRLEEGMVKDWKVTHAEASNKHEEEGPSDDSEEYMPGDIIELDL